MSEIDEHLERLINRALDGELNDDERLALDRELVRNPEARRLMDRCAELDDLAGDALRMRFGGEHESAPVAAIAAGRPIQGGYHRAWWLLPGAVAAALLAVFLVFASSESRQAPVAGGDQVDPGNNRRVAPIVNQHQPTMPDNGIMRAVHRPVPARTDRAINRGIYGVRGRDGSILFIEVNHARTRAQPGNQSGLIPVGGDL